MQVFFFSKRLFISVQTMVRYVAVGGTDLTDCQVVGTGPIEWGGKGSANSLEAGLCFVFEGLAKEMPPQRHASADE
jgi:hypothetical protein